MVKNRVLLSLFKLDSKAGTYPVEIVLCRNPVDSELTQTSV
jgi:hypothetical protein